MIDFKKLQNGSDIRGVAIQTEGGPEVNLTKEVAGQITGSFVYWLSKKVQKNPVMLKICVGQDSRLSGDMLKEGVLEAISLWGAEGYDALFEKDRQFMIPLEEGPFYGCKQFMGAYGTLGGVLVNHRLEVMTDDYEKIPGLYCVGTDACTIYGDSYNFCIPGNTMGFCLNSGRIAGENAAELAFGDGGDEDWDDGDGDWD